MTEHSPHDLAAGFSLDALDEPQRLLFLGHLPDCAACQAELAGFSEVAEALAASLAVAPPPELEQAVMQGVRAHDAPAAATPIPPRRTGRVLLAVAASIALFGVGVGVGTAIDAPAPAADLAAELGAAVPVVSASDAVFMPLDIQGSTTRLVVSHEMNGAAVLGDDVPMPADGGHYQMWQVNPDGTMTPVGTFQPTDEGHVAMALHGDVNGAAAYLLTIESEPDAVHPTMPPIDEVSMA